MESSSCAAWTHSGGRFASLEANQRRKSSSLKSSMYRVNPISGRRRVGGICDRLSPIKGVRRQVSSMALTVGSHLSSKLWRCKTSAIISDWLSAEAAKSSFSSISCKHTPALVPRGKWWMSRPSESGDGRFQTAWHGLRFLPDRWQVAKARVVRRLTWCAGSNR